MGPTKLTSLLRASSGAVRERGTSCPDEEQLAAYVDGGLPPDDAERLESHLADCDACIALVGLLSRQRVEPVAHATPQPELARPDEVLRPQRRSWRRFAPHLAAAAAVLVTISALTNLLQLQGTGSPDVPGERATRNGSDVEPQLHVLYPTTGITLDAGHLRFRWSAVEGSRYYEVRIVSESGDLIREERVTGTEWQPADPLDLRPGVEYFVQVDAYPGEAKTVSSEHVPFRVTPRP